MRLIDADALPKYTGYALSANDVANAVENAPTIDAIPVVRCRECKYSDTFTPDCTEATFPLKCLSIRYGGVYPDWFCEHGQRREDGDA